MLTNFRSYQLAIELYHGCEQVQARSYLRDQLLRASLSIVLNLSEGSAKPTEKDRKRFYAIALGSCRETQTLLKLVKNQELFQRADRLGGGIYRLVYGR